MWYWVSWACWGMDTGRVRIGEHIEALDFGTARIGRARVWEENEVLGRSGKGTDRGWRESVAGACSARTAWASASRPHLCVRRISL